MTLLSKCIFESSQSTFHPSSSRPHHSAHHTTHLIDSTVLIHLLTTLNQRFNYGLTLHLLSIDEGIKGYRDDSLATVQSNSRFYNLPLTVLSYKDLYGYTMDEIVKMTGPKSNCTFCGVFRRQALDRGAEMVKVDHLVTGHNADDIAETVLMNVMRGDVVRLRRCTEIVTKSNRCIKRSKPLKYAYEKEVGVRMRHILIHQVVMYAYFNRLEYFSTECTYSPAAYRGFARTFIKDLEAIRPRAIIG